MDTRQAEMEAWLGAGGRVVAASERAARAAMGSYHRARQAEGLSAWPVPDILDWKSFVHSAWRDSGSDARLLLNALQEQSLWEQIIAGHGSNAALLPGSRRRLAALAMQAHSLLCSHAPQCLRAASRSGWQGDAAAYSAWLSAFNAQCASEHLLSPARLPVELIARLEPDRAAAARAPLLLIGFDRILPAQRRLFDAWGAWRQEAPGEPAVQIDFQEARDTPEELSACARWCAQRLASNPGARLLVIAQDARTLRGQVERVFLEHVGPASLLEFSLGIPLIQADLPHGAYLLLRWLTQPIAEHELDWLFASGQIASTPEETRALQKSMLSLRLRGHQRPEWTLRAWMQHPVASAGLPPAWVRRLTAAAQHLAEFARRPQRPVDYAELIPQLLESAGWPGARALSSAEFQAVQRWQQTVEACGSLGFDGRRIAWPVFLSALAAALAETLFDPETRDAPILIAGPAESAGLTADGIWFLGADEDAWPSAGSTHALIPLPLQREADMPHATAQLDWDLARSITERLLSSASEIHFSYARQKSASETRPSRLIQQLAGAPVQLLHEVVAPTVQTIPVQDFSQVPYPLSNVAGGSSVLTEQSQCPFRAFATSRCGARPWDPGEAGLTAAQRGQLLHAVLHRVWAGPPDGLRSLAELRQLADRESFVAGHVDCVFRGEPFASLQQRMPARYLALEAGRLTRMVAEWLDYEAARAPFTVVDTEVKRTVQIEGLNFDVRLDRIDRLNDDTLLVIDYKSGEVTPASWNTPRPEDVQLPLYAEFALDAGAGELGGLVFAKVLPGKLTFAGLLHDARAALLPNLTARSSLVRIPLTSGQRLAWQSEIKQLARDFAAGNAAVAPRDYPKTCARCRLQSLCRAEEPENQALLACAEEDGDEEPAHE